MGKKKIEEDLSILKTMDNETVVSLIDSVYEYYMNPDSFPISKLTPGIRAPFSAIYQVFCKADRMYESLHSLGLNKEVKQKMLSKISNIYYENASRFGLLTEFITNPKSHLDIHWL